MSNKIKITREKLSDIWVSLTELDKVTQGGVSIAYAIARNVTELQPEIDALQKASTPSEKYLEYEEKKKEIGESLALKNEDGTPQMKPLRPNVSQYVITDHVALKEAIEPLNEEYAGAIKEREEQQKAIVDLMQGEVSVTVQTFTMADLQAEGVIDPKARNLAKIIAPLLDTVIV